MSDRDDLEAQWRQESIQKAASMIAEDFVLRPATTMSITAGALENVAQKASHYERVTSAALFLLKTAADQGLTLADLNVDRNTLVRRLNEAVGAAREYHQLAERRLTTPSPFYGGNGGAWEYTNGRTQGSQSDVDGKKAMLDDTTAILETVRAGGKDAELFAKIAALPLKSQLQYRLDGHGMMF